MRHRSLVASQSVESKAVMLWFDLSAVIDRGVNGFGLVDSTNRHNRGFEIEMLDGRASHLLRLCVEQQVLLERIIDDLLAHNLDFGVLVLTWNAELVS